MLGGIRVATANHSRGYLNINGTDNHRDGRRHLDRLPTQHGWCEWCRRNEHERRARFKLVGPISIRITEAPYNLSGRFQVGDRGKGMLNMSGGTITVTRNVALGTKLRGRPRDGSIINDDGRHDYNRWAGNATLASPPTDRYRRPIAASIILDGPTAVFTHDGYGSIPGSDHRSSMAKHCSKFAKGHAAWEVEEHDNPTWRTVPLPTPPSM